MARLPFLETLRARLLGVVLLAIVPALAVTITTAYEERAQARAQASLVARRLADMNSAVLRRMLESVQLTLTVAARVADLTESAGCGTRFTDVVTPHELQYANAGIVDTQGHVRCSSAPLADLANRPWLRAAGEHDSAVAWDRNAGGLVIAQLVPASSEPPLVFFVAIRPEWLTRLAVDSLGPAGSIVTLMDGDGHVVVQQANAPWEERPFGADDVAKAVRAGDLEETEMVGTDGVVRFHAFSTVHRRLDRALIVGMGTPAAAGDSLVTQRLSRNLSVLGVIALASLGLAWVLGEVTITRRVNAMARAARELAAGNLSARTGVPSGRDEIGVLADHFDKMAASLQRQAHQARASTEALRNLTHRLQSVREDEQTRIARDIHDQLGQVLTALKMDVATVQRQVGDAHPDVTARLREMSAMLDTSVHTVRRIAGELRPPLLQDVGLAAALEWHAHEFAGRAGIEVDVDVAGDLRVLPFPIGIGLFRIVQEALTNVARHARATHVAIRLRQRNGQLELEIVDNGAGFVVSERQLTLGMLGMRERAALMGGTLDVASTPGEGARVVVRVPIEGQVPS